MAMYIIKRFSNNSPTINLSINYLERKYGYLPYAYKIAMSKNWTGFKLITPLPDNQSQFIDNFIEIGNPDKTWVVNLFPITDIEPITRNDEKFRNFNLRQYGLLIIGGDPEGNMYLLCKPNTEELYIVERNNEIGIPKLISRNSEELFNQINYDSFIGKEY